MYACTEFVTNKLIQLEKRVFSFGQSNPAQSLYLYWVAILFRIKNLLSVKFRSFPPPLSVTSHATPLLGIVYIILKGLITYDRQPSLGLDNYTN